MKRKRDYFIVPFVAILVAVAFRSFVFDHFHVPSGSMKGTLLIGDKIAISSFSYGYGRYSIPFGIIPFSGRIFETQPKRGDIIVFKLPSKRTINYVKRLIGLPGDKISIAHGIVTINNQELVQTPVESFFDIDIGKDIKQYEERMPDGTIHYILDDQPDSIVDNIPEFTVPDGHYFFMGDNRDNSLDSRFAKVGFVPEELLIGRVQRILISSPKSLFNPLGWGDVRLDRVWKKPA